MAGTDRPGPWFPGVSCAQKSDVKHGPGSCQPWEARLPPTGIVMEGNLGAAPLRHLPGISPRRVETCGGIVCRVQVWFQNQRRRQLKQSQSPSEYVNQEGEGGPTSTTTPPTAPPRPQSSSPGNSAREAWRKWTVILSFSNKVPCANLHEGSLPGDYQQERTGSSYGNPRNLNPDMVSKLKSSEPTAETKRARQWLGPRAKQHSSHDYSCSRGPKGPTRCSELLFPLLTLPARGEHSTIGRGKIETQGSSGEREEVKWGKAPGRDGSCALVIGTRLPQHEDFCQAPKLSREKERSQGIAKKPRNHSATCTAIRSNGFFGQPGF
ncbi:hypothetical protein CapIbe_024032 [Capra ibex]